jgi:hypothetical protein
MNIKKEIKDGNVKSELVAATLAQAFTLLALAPYDNWGHEGSPAEMAAFVVKTAKERGNMGFVENVVLGERWYREAS